MRKKETPVEQAEDTQPTAPAFNCANCEDSGKECYVCGAGRQAV